MNTTGICLLLLAICFTAALSRCPTMYEELDYPCHRSYDIPSSTENRVPTWCRFFAHMHACYVRTTAECADTDFFQRNQERVEEWTNQYVLDPEFCATTQ